MASADARYSASGKPNPIANLVLVRKAKKVRADGAVARPRFLVLVATEHEYELLEGPIPASAPVASLARDEVAIELERGLIWKRVDITAGGCVYTIFLNSLFGGPQARQADARRARSRVGHTGSR